VDKQSFELWANSVGLAVLGSTLGAFQEFLDSLYEANQVMNLTGIDKEEAWLRHFADSLLFADLIPQGVEVLDVGSGPGFPAWPLACARPDLQVTALDSSGKMLAFLQSQPLPNLSLELGRAEDFDSREDFDIVTGRAVAPLAIQLELSAGPCRVGGAVIPMRTTGDDLRNVKTQALGLKLESEEERKLPETDIVRVFPIYRKVKETPDRYPRRWAEIKASPLNFEA
jgi:16S rRNA (guanine527-N7)-methyltransferase